MKENKGNSVDIIAVKYFLKKNICILFKKIISSIINLIGREIVFNIYEMFMQLIFKIKIIINEIQPNNQEKLI